MKNTKNIALFNPKANLQLKGTYELVVYNTYFEVCDENGNEIYYENSDEFWCKAVYDQNNNQTYFENSDGHWSKREYDENSNQVYYENSSGYWDKREYDENNNEIYRENSRDSILVDNRPQPTTKVTLELTQSQLDKIKSML